MSYSNSQRVAAFMLAFLFLLTTVGAAVFVVIELNSGDAGIVVDQQVTQNTTVQQQQEEPVQFDPLPDFTTPVEITELRFDELVVGDGDEVQPGDTVTINYTGARASDGVVFDSTQRTGTPATFPLDNLIAGWQEGIPGMLVGGTRRLYIPAELGYGAAGSGDLIPPNEALVFDIELIATQR